MTVMACASAASYAVPPLVTFDCQTLNPWLTKGEFQELHIVYHQIVRLMELDEH